jgi:hypothetical protein
MREVRNPTQVIALRKSTRSVQEVHKRCQGGHRADYAEGRGRLRPLQSQGDGRRAGFLA